jgi:hypothetical protein
MKNIGFNRSAGTFNKYDSGEIDGTTTEVEVTLDDRLSQLLIHPLVASTVKLNDSEKEIYLPAGVWTPISVLTDSFTIKTISESGKIYWQGWIL